jgi:hypothetical protein
MAAGTCCCPAEGIITSSAECKLAQDSLHLSRSHPVVLNDAMIPDGCSHDNTGGGMRDAIWNTMGSTSHLDVNPICRYPSR